MSITVGLVANVYNEINALPGWLETHLLLFDDIRVLHAGPGGEYSTDGTIELLEKWDIPILFESIDEGFGAVRTKAIHSSPCDYVVILDADERFLPVNRVLTCAGEATPQNEVDDILRTYDFHDLKTVQPNWENVARLGSRLRVDIGETYNQGARLREILESKPDAVCTVRRHWHDFSFRRPTQNWQVIPDWQLRIVANRSSTYYEGQMHERINGVSNIFRADMERGPFFEHFHFTFKHMEQEQRAHDIAVYNAIHEGRKPPTWNEFKS